MGELEIRLNDLDKRIVLANKLIEDLIARMRKDEIRLENFESVLKQGFDSIATYFSKMNQGEFAIDLRKLLKRLSDELSDINARSKEQKQNPSAKKAIEMILNDLRITCLNCNKSYKFAELRILLISDKIYCPNCKHEFKTLKIKR